jgi:hypothetical protein
MTDRQLKDSELQWQKVEPAAPNGTKVHAPTTHPKPPILHHNAAEVLKPMATNLSLL